MSDTPLLTSEKKRQRDEKGRLLPGNTANPAGRPVGSVSIISAIARKLHTTYYDENNKTKRTYLEAMLGVILDDAIATKNSKPLLDLIPYFDQKQSFRIDVGADKESIEELTSFFQSIGMGNKKQP